MSSATEAVKPVPNGFKVHTESSTSILFASKSTSAVAPVFLNPVQEYNRDLSILAIRTWSEQRQQEKELAWQTSVKKRWAKRKAKSAAVASASNAVADTDGEGASKRRKVGEEGEAQPVEPAAKEESKETVEETSEEKLPAPPQFKFTALEALSATGLRAIRYAKEIPLLRYVLANDLSSSAVLDIKRNIEYNDLLALGLPPSVEATPSATLSKAQIDDLTLGKVRPNEGDACVVMYNHRTDATRFDCIDLDPYGSAVPFLDAAIGAVADGGILCVTCTDAGVLAGHNYPEKAYSHYGGVCVNAEYCHEVGLRLILHAIATTAGRYGRHIEPLLSLSIDFYMRVFVRVATSPKEVKALPSKTALLYYCHDCQAPYFQPLGKVDERPNGNVAYHIPSGPPPGVGEKCGECGGKFHIGGPLWAAPIHNIDFIRKMMDNLDEDRDKFGTASRIEGMLTVASDELEVPLYFTPAKMSSMFHSTAPPLSTVASALLNAKYKVSRSHATPGSIKTDAPRSFVMDIFREWIKKNPVKMENVKATSPTSRLLAKAQIAEVNLEHNHETDEALRSKVKLVRYQLNPEPNWGPGRAASKGAGKGKGERASVPEAPSVEN